MYCYLHSVFQDFIFHDGYTVHFQEIAHFWALFWQFVKNRNSTRFECTFQCFYLQMFPIVSESFKLLLALPGKL